MNNEKRMHPAAILILFFTRLREFIVPLILIFVVGGTGGGFSFRWLLPAFIVFFLITSIFNWLFYKYTFNETELHIKHGVFVKKNRYIRRKRVQSFDVTAGILQRLFGLVKVKIETAGGGGEPEVEMVALEKVEAQNIKQQLLSEPGTDEEGVNSTNEEREITADEQVTGRSAPVGPEVRWHLPKSHLLLMAVTSGGVGLVFSALAALFSQFDQFIPTHVYENTIGFFLASSILFILLLIVVIAFLAWLIAIGLTLIKYGRFKVEKKGDDLIVSRGLLERRQLTLKTYRITAVRVVISPLRQPFRFASVYVESAGGGSQEEQGSTLLLPMVPFRSLEKTVQHFVTDFPIERPLTSLPRRALLRYLLRSAGPVFAVALGASLFVPYGAWSFILVPVALALGWWRYNSGGWTLDESESYVLLQSRLFQLARVSVPRHKIQDATYARTVTQKYRDLAHFSVAVLSTAAGKTFQVKDLSEDDARSIHSWYSYRPTSFNQKREDEEE
ncbi:PH domain-containing protein [Salsuginibacillus kocurii]|uniref:PH domain-containing protein n=1 Tax=Salsuginibacillus kocurii TaxID=427078 RepID=UPI00039BEE0B|nr:PH domain-containing protein [Salsuginibacillus kocurii]